MIRGRYGASTAAPYIEATVGFPRFNAEAEISFRIDTGADRTTITPGILRQLKIDYKDLAGGEEAFGIGGSEEMFRENCDIFFLDEEQKKLFKYAISVAILPEKDRYLKYPALLGRDVINQWRLVCDASNRLVEIEIRTADDTIDLNAG